MTTVDADGFPPAETHWGPRRMILLIVSPTGPDECKIEWRTEHDWQTPEDVAHDLITAGEIIASGGTPGVTSTGMIVREVNGS